MQLRITVRPHFIELINSERYDGHGRREDLLHQPEWLSGFLARWPGIGVPTSRNKHELERLRALLRTFVTVQAERRSGPDADLIEQLNGVLRASGLRPTLARAAPGIRIEHGSDGSRWKAMLGEIVMSLGDALSSEPSRLKICANHGCRWVFIDESRNCSRRWCDSSACGNLTRVRAFRDRQRAGG